VVVLGEGKGRLFTDPDPDKARYFFRNKSRTMENKLMGLSEAIRGFVHDGEYLAIGGFGANRTPVAACHEIVRQGRKNMGFAGHTSTHDFQILSAGKVFNRVDIAYVIGLEAIGFPHVPKNTSKAARWKSVNGPTTAFLPDLRQRPWVYHMFLHVICLALTHSSIVDARSQNAHLPARR